MNKSLTNKNNDGLITYSSKKPIISFNTLKDIVRDSSELKMFSVLKREGRLEELFVDMVKIAEGALMEYIIVNSDGYRNVLSTTIMPSIIKYIVSNYVNQFSLPDFKVMMERGALGLYGEIYKIPMGKDIRLWVDRYIKERDQAFDNENYNRHLDKKKGLVEVVNHGVSEPIGMTPENMKYLREMRVRLTAKMTMRSSSNEILKENRRSSLKFKTVEELVNHLIEFEGLKSERKDSVIRDMNDEIQKASMEMKKIYEGGSGEEMPDEGYKNIVLANTRILIQKFKKQINERNL